MTSTEVSPTPSLGWRLGAGGGIVAMAVLSVSDRAWDVADRGSGGRMSRSSVRALLGATVAVHVVEAGAAGVVAHRAGLPARRWVISTLCWGFPTLLRLRRASAAAGDGGQP